MWATDDRDTDNRKSILLKGLINELIIGIKFNRI